ncbi:MAG: hypothetical protein ABIO37_13800 [Caulobacteraceae bacterium]
MSDTPERSRAAKRGAALDTRGWLAIGGVAQVTLALWLLARIAVPKENHDLFVVLISQVVGAGYLAMIQYFFGSSKGATDVRDQLGRVLDKIPPQQDPKP